MRIFNETKSQEIQEENVDYSKYKLAQTKLFVKHHEAVIEVKEQSHYEVIKIYDNGGKDVKKVIDVPGIKAHPAHDEYEDILYLVPLSQSELAQNKIAELKSKLAKTDYQAIKFAEGELSAEEYAEMKEQRKQWRIQINELETQINN